MKKYIIIVIIVCLSAFCGCTRTIYTPVRSSVRVVDTITRTEPDSATVRALFECDSVGQVVMRELVEYKGKEAAQDVSFERGELRVETRWKTQYIERIREVHDTVTVVETRDIVRQVRHVPSFFWWLLGLNVLGVALWLLKKFMTKK